MRHAIIALAPVALAACAATTPPPIAVPGPPLAYASLGETVYVDGPKVTPLDVLEDSRCPHGVQCVWAGRVRVKVRVHLGTGDELHAVTLGEPIHVADGSLELMRVVPEKSEAAIPPQDYRFGFRFMGGL